MQFTTIQSEKTKKIIMYLVDNKRVTKNKFLHLEHLRWLQGAKYSCSITTRTKSNNFRHSANL